MAEKQEHPQAKWLRAIADGETLQKQGADNVWCSVSLLQAYDMLSRGGVFLDWRIKPRTITIGKYEVAEPVQTSPSRNTPYWSGDFTTALAVTDFIWKDNVTDNYLLESGMCWLKREDAELAAKAITELLTGKPA